MINLTESNFCSRKTILYSPFLPSFDLPGFAYTRSNLDSFKLRLIFVQDIGLNNAIEKLWFSTSIFVSTLSILLVAVYQLITIRIDPFGARRIITTPRCSGACFATWTVAFGMAALVAYFPNKETRLMTTFLVSGMAITITGICYVLIFRSISQTVGDMQQENRRRENQRVLRTFGLVYGTTSFTWILSVISVSVRRYIDVSGCLLVFVIVLIWVLLISNYLANTLIYWWRLKEFRAVVLTVIRSSDGNKRVVPNSNVHSVVT